MEGSIGKQYPVALAHLDGVRHRELNVLPVPHTEEKTIIKKERD